MRPRSSASTPPKSSGPPTLYKPAIFFIGGSQMTTLPAWPKLGDAAEGVMG